MTRFFEQFVFLPLRTFLFTMGKVAETLKGWQELGEDALIDVTSTESHAEPPSRPSATFDPYSSYSKPAQGFQPHAAPLIPPRREPDRRQAFSPVPSRHLFAEEPEDHLAESTELSPNLRFVPATLETFRATDSEETQNPPENLKEERRMYMDQDLSGDQVKVVLYSIVNVVPGIADNERIVAGPCQVAFSDDMSPEDFTAWIIAERCPKYAPEPPKPCDPCPPAGGPYESPCFPDQHIEKCWDKKYLRVAYTVIGRFNVADINWEQLQAMSLAKMVGELTGLIQRQQPDNNALRVATRPATEQEEAEEPKASSSSSKRKG